LKVRQKRKKKKPVTGIEDKKGSYVYIIQNKAISYAEKIKHHPVFEGKEPLHIAAMLIFLPASKT
jgi:hypothetical protein